MEKLLSLYPQLLSNQIHELLVNGGLGISCVNMGFNPCTEKFLIDDITRNNTFILDVPYAGKHLKWNVMFNDEDIGFSPDFDFLNDEFLSDPSFDLIEKHIPSLRDWDVFDNTCLTRVIREFLVLYKEFQLKKLGDNKLESQVTEYMLLTQDMGISEEDIEVLVESKDSVLFYILIRVPLYTLPPYYNLDSMQSGFLINPGEDVAVLKVKFGCTGVFPKLQLSPRLESIIGSSCDLHIPQYKKDSGLIEYVPAVSNLINSKLEAISKSFTARNEFISALIASHGKTILEYDTIRFLKASILLEIQDCYLILLIQLGPNFPLQKPELIISPITAINGASNEIITKFPFNPKWSEEQILKEILVYISKTVARFVDIYS